MRLECRIEGLDCANCALKVEKALGGIAGVREVGVVFAAGRLHLETDRQDPALAGEILRTVDERERGAVVYPQNAAAKALWQAAGLPVEVSAQPQGSGPCHDREHRQDHGGDCACGNCHDHEEHGHDHEHHHDHDHGFGGGKVSLILYAAAAVVFCVGLLPLPPVGKAVAFGLAVGLAGWPVLLQAVRSVRHLDLDENLLLVVAVIAAFAMGEWFEAALVTLLFRLGNLLEDVALSRSRRSIESLAAICPDTARLVTAEGVREVAAETLRPGDLIEVAPFERVAADSVVEEGSSYLDTAALTGESRPVAAGVGDEVRSGVLNGEGLLRLRVMRPSEESAAARVLQLVEDAAAQKGRGERFITRFARVYTPAILAAAVLLCLLPTLLGGTFSEWLYRALVFLVASCPCALVISIPLAYFAAIGSASRQGVLIKGGRFVEQLAACRAVALDKTGTLTTGQLAVTDTQALGLSPAGLLELAGRLEAHSQHPLARAIAAAAGHPDPLPGQYREIPGQGVRVDGENFTALIGSHRLLREAGVEGLELARGTVLVALQGRLAGSLTVSDAPRPDAAATVERLRQMGVQRVALLTGDGETAARQTADACGIDEVYAALLPEDKVVRLRELKEQASPTVFVGDGINDAPVLALADVGLAMGLGTDAAIESADGVLSGSRLARLPDAIRLCRRAMRMVRFNTVFALGVKAAVLVLGALGFAPMWLVVFADVGVTVITVLNSSRLLLTRRQG